MRNPLARALLSVVLVASVPLGAQHAIACGYHDPKQVAVGVLNWVYPKSLYVKSAVWRAEDAGLLAPRQNDAKHDLFAMNRAAAGLRKLAEQLSERAPPTPGLQSFSLLFIDTLMWTRFQPDEGRGALSATVHVNGPAPGDVVIITHSKVASALAQNTLTAKSAFAYGLVRYYGEKQNVDAVRLVLEQALDVRQQRHVAGPAKKE